MCIRDRLSSAITEAQLAGMQKGRPLYDLEALAAAAHDEWIVLTGCRKGAVRQALAAASNRADAERNARHELDLLTELFGHERVFVELTDHGHPGDDTRNDQLGELAAITGPVSYTHLDVYKRQGLATACSTRTNSRCSRPIDAANARTRCGFAMGS